MTETSTAAIILAAGMGTRMKSALPKTLHAIAGRPMLYLLLDTVAGLGLDRVVVVSGPELESHEDEIAAHPANPVIAYQAERLGTGHAVLAARGALPDFSGDALILFAGDPLITAGTCRAVLARLRGADEPAVVVVGKRPAEPGRAGRLVTSDGDRLDRIAEAGDAGPEELAIPLCNAGAMAVGRGRLFPLLDRVTNDNAKGEYYLTDIVGLARSDGAACAYVEAPDEEAMGIDTRADLARAEAVVQERLRSAAMDAGATLIDPATVFLSWDTKLGRDVTVGPNVIFGPGVTVGDKVTIRAFSHLEGARVSDGAIVGPFARLRPGADIGADVHIGNFVEIKNAVVAQGAKINHLSYVGDASVGPAANIGAGTITCNYDGYLKHRTEIGAGAFIGSNTSLVAPVAVGAGAVTGAGSVITKDVGDGNLAVARGEQRQIEDWAAVSRAAHNRAAKQAAD